MSSTADLGNEKIGKLLFSLAVPTITAQIVNMLYNIVDRIYIGHMPEVGAQALTGVGLVFPIIMLISAFSALIGMGGAPRAAIMMGKQDEDQAEQVLGNCLVSLIGSAVILTVVFLLFGEKLLWAIGGSAVTIPYAVSYLQIYVFGTIFVQIALGMNMFITTQGFAKVSMMTVVIGAVINIVLDPIFIFGFHMGVRGAALATILSQGVSALWVMKFLLGKKTKLKIRKKNLKLSGNIMLPVLALGLSPFVMQSTESLLSIALNSSLQKYGGDMAVGAYAIIASVLQMITMPLQGLTQGAQPIISFNYGAGNLERVRKTIRLLIICALTYAIAGWLVVMLAPQALVQIFSNDMELMDMTVWAMRIFMAGIGIFGAQIGCQQSFLALGQAKNSIILALLRKIVLLIPLIYILPMFFEDKLMAVFLAEPVSDVVAAIVTIITFGTWYKKNLTKENVKEA